MTGTLVAVLWLGAIVLALTFLGRRILLWTAPEFSGDTGLSAAAGVSAFLVLCGIVDLLRIGSASLFVIPVACGAAAQIYLFWRHRGDAPEGGIGWTGMAWLAAGAFALVFAIFLLNGGDWVYGTIDDRHGYLVLPERILAEGSLGRDPFLERRVEAGLGGGGGYFYVLFRSLLPMAQTRLADVGLGSVLLVLLVISHARDLGLSVVRTVVLLFIALAVATFSPIINNTPETIGKAMIYALFRLAHLIAEREDRPSIRGAAPLALMMFAVIALKTTLLPAAVTLGGVCYLARLFRRFDWRLIAEGGACIVLILLFMTPWMLSMHQVAQTYWFPFLGFGLVEKMALTGITTPWMYFRDTGRLMLFLSPMLLLTLVQFRDNLGKRRYFAALAPLLYCLALAAAELKFTIFPYRYGHAVAAAAFLYFAVEAMALGYFVEAFSKGFPARGLVRQGARYSVAVLCVLSLIVMALNNTTGRRWFVDGTMFPGKDKEREQIAQARQRVAAAQQSVPAGQDIVAIVDWPAFFDYARNPMHIMDNPGWMGPRPMPEVDDERQWADYLLDNGIRYVIYSYRNEAGFNKEHIAHDLAIFTAKETYSEFQIRMVRKAGLLHDVFSRISRCGTVVHDDGEIIVVRLERQ